MRGVLQATFTVYHTINYRTNYNYKHRLLQNLAVLTFSLFNITILSAALLFSKSDNLFNIIQN